ncbi:MAG: DUF2207 domain-containing protein [Bifidobacteriaceae bacterium]|nr:DUF2207 domain-containing protein [Bifidobacteriaceae bacterium]
MSAPSGEPQGPFTTNPVASGTPFSRSTAGINADSGSNAPFQPSMGDGSGMSVNALGGGNAPWFNLKRFIGALACAVAMVLVIVFSIVAVSGSSGSTAALQATSDEINAQIETNGDVSVNELVTIQMRKRDSGPYHQLYRTIQLDSSLVTDVSDVTVTRIMADTSTTYTRQDFVSPDLASSVWDSQYAGHWYLYDETNNTDYLPVTDALPISAPDKPTQQKQLEFGWNIPTTESGTMTFRITYTLRNLATEYSDVSETFWELVSADQSMPIKKLTATISLPQGANTSNTWAWLHTEAKSSNSRDSDGTLHFEINNIETSDYVDVIALTDNSMMSGVARASTDARKDYRMSTEAAKEKQWHDQQVAAARRSVVFVLFFAITGIALIIWAVVGAFKSYRNSQPWLAAGYWHDPPAMSPGAAAYMNNVIDSSKDAQKCALAGTVLSLASKHCLLLVPGPARWYEGIDLVNTDPSQYRSYIEGVASANGKPGWQRKSVTTTVCLLVNPTHGDNIAAYNLCESEAQLLRVFALVADKLGTPVFDMDQMSDQWSNWRSGIEEMETFQAKCSTEFSELEATNSQAGWHTAPTLVALVYLLALYFSWQLGSLSTLTPLVYVAGLLVIASICFSLAYGKSRGITPNGQRWAEQVQGFKQYLLDFSNFHDRGVSDLVLWDRYLVYAASFGISKEVLEQLYLAEPRLQDASWVDTHTNNSLLYWYAAPRARDSGMMADPTATAAMNFGSLDDFTDSLSTSLSDLQSSFDTAFSDLHAHDSGGSFGGSGGSFSGGGFGGGGGGGGGGGFGGR